MFPATWLRREKAKIKTEEIEWIMEEVDGGEGALCVSFFQLFPDERWNIKYENVGERKIKY
jgi:hypothetical protein